MGARWLGKADDLPAFAPACKEPIVVRMRALLLATCLATAGLALAACGLPAPTGDSGIEGQVTIGPTCPVERVDQPCPDKPFQAEVTVESAANGREVLRFTSGTDGRFRVALAPGTYRLVPRSPQGGALPRAEPLDVTVPQGQYVTADIRFDSGIR